MSDPGPSRNDTNRPSPTVKKIKRKPPPMYDPSESSIDSTLQKQSLSLISPPRLHSQVTGSPVLRPSHDCDIFAQDSARTSRTKGKAVRPATEPVYRPGLNGAAIGTHHLAGVGDLAVKSLYPANHESFRPPAVTFANSPRLTLECCSEICVNERYPSPSSSLSSPSSTVTSASLDIVAPCSINDPTFSDVFRYTPTISSIEIVPHFQPQSADATRRVRFTVPTLDSESVSVHQFDEYALPTRAQLEKASRLPVLSATGESIRFGSLWSTQKTIVLFLRHFLCPACQDYMYSVAQNLPQSALRDANVNLVVISNGPFQMIDYYAKIFRVPFAIYTDPEHRLYQALGMTRRSLKLGPKGTYIRHGALGAMGMVLWNALKVGMPLWRGGGDVMQLGGEFILGPGLDSCSFAHRMVGMRSHLPILDVVARSGVEMWLPQACDMLSSTQQSYEDAEEAWVQERKRILDQIRRRKAVRRGGLEWCEDVPNDEFFGSGEEQSSGNSIVDEDGCSDGLTDSAAVEPRPIEASPIRRRTLRKSRR